MARYSTGKRILIVVGTVILMVVLVVVCISCGMRANYEKKKTQIKNSVAAYQKAYDDLVDSIRQIDWETEELILTFDGEHVIQSTGNVREKVTDAALQTAYQNYSELDFPHADNIKVTKNASGFTVRFIYVMKEGLNSQMDFRLIYLDGKAEPREAGSYQKWQGNWYLEEHGLV